MSDLAFQISLLAGYIFALIAFRRHVEASEAGRKEDERLRREAQEREWRVGIPYDPEER